jgi:hypothetical protein
MKKNCLAFIFILLFTGSLYSQNVYKEAVEKTIGTETYLFSTNPEGHVKNKRNSIGIDNVIDNWCDTWRVDSSKPGNASIDSIFKSAFAKDKLREWVEKEIAFSLQLYCDAKGNVLEVELFGRNMQSLSLEDIVKIEQTAKKCKWKFYFTCPDTKYYLIGKRVQISKLAE